MGDGSMMQADGGSSDGSTHADSGTTLHCMPFPVSGGGAAGSYLAQQTAACACDSNSPFPDAGLGQAGAPCTDYRNCALTCCACADPARSFGAAICKPDGTCADNATACAGVLADSFASMSICH
jgi:hypothetical protein